uniref:Hemocyte protein-glutamine gamma-glutamyltransferase-like isoform X1 n=1 Tax=Crassostrea virginica TaxID=6565 RepID=A0A8B8EPX9_CRAVI|nr:hemocyte protein-glutamine gamma-glutamyltransferase-like isoform X1 [Crassostrea virginica]
MMYETWSPRRNRIAPPPYNNHRMTHGDRFGNNLTSTGNEFNRVPSFRNRAFNIPVNIERTPTASTRNSAGTSLPVNIERIPSTSRNRSFQPFVPVNIDRSPTASTPYSTEPFAPVNIDRSPTATSNNRTAEMSVPVNIERPLSSNISRGSGPAYSNSTPGLMNGSIGGPRERSVSFGRYRRSADEDEDDNDEDDVSSNRAKVSAIDILSEENSRQHHTEKYDVVQGGGLVVRRGQAFNLLLQFDRRFSLKKNTLRLVFKTGPNPKPGKGTHIQCLLQSERRSTSPSEWTAVLRSRHKENGVLVSVTPPADCIVAEWRLTVENIVSNSTKPRAFKFTLKESIFILFNPWCREDDVYFPDSNKLNEYVLNDSGVIFNGDANYIGQKPWFYGQFESGILEASLFCVQLGFDSQFGYAMSNPTRVSRIISKIVNFNQDNGVLVGNWSGDYSGGKSPSSWNGSVAILRQFVKTQRPVKWGQCFIFAGIVTTICRALGIPCRTISNFSSAHDTDGNIKIDIYVDSNRREVVPSNQPSESIWNFHCWNEVWMERRDLPSGYGGWQIIDATPQEESSGFNQCGPASLRAIKEGRCELLYDTLFVFAEVNADKVVWARGEGGKWSIVSVDPSAIGKKISTKVPDGLPVTGGGARIRDDITDEYKFPDASVRERLAVKKASRARDISAPYINENKVEDVRFHGFVDRNYVTLGQDFVFSFSFTNSGTETRTISAKMLCETVLYTGVRDRIVKQQSYQVPVSPKSNGEMTMEILASDYLHKINDNATFKVSMVAEVLETGQLVMWDDDFRLIKPNMEIEVSSSSVEVNKPFQCRLRFKNPLNAILRNCSISVDGPGIDGEFDQRISDVAARTEWVAEMTMTPRTAGRKQITVTFNSDLIDNVSGSADVLVSSSSHKHGHLFPCF